MVPLLTTVFCSDALYKEQVENFSNPDGTMRSMTYEELRALPILDSVIRETLRMHPPIHSIMRYVRDDVVVPGSLSAPSKDKTYIIPKGNFVMASPTVSQMDPRIWKNPETWEPSRWSDPEGVAAQAFNTYLDDSGEKIDYGFGAVSKGTESPYQPFGAGKHRCIGEQVLTPDCSLVNSFTDSFALVRVLATGNPHLHCHPQNGTESGDYSCSQLPCTFCSLLRFSARSY